MLYWKYSSNRIIFLNEYWILVPTMLLADYIIIRKILSHKKKTGELRKLQEKIKRYKELEKLHRIAYLACNLSSLSSYLACSLALSSIFMVLGREKFANVDYIECGIEEGLRYLDNSRLRKIIHHLFGKKRQGKIIYITSTAVCHLAKMYGTQFFALPVAVGDFGTTNLYQTVRKIIVTLFLGAAGPLLVVGGGGVIIAVFLGTVALKLSYIDLDKLPTSPVDETLLAGEIKPRIADTGDVVIVNYGNRLKAPSIVPEKPECWLPGQAFLNPTCKIKPTEVPTAVDMVSHGLDYDKVVNMQDVTGLDRIDFSDIFDLGQTKPSISKSTKGKMVNFLEMFGDPAEIDGSETWEASSITDAVPKRMNLRTRN